MSGIFTLLTSTFTSLVAPVFARFSKTASLLIGARVPTTGTPPTNNRTFIATTATTPTLSMTVAGNPAQGTVSPFAANGFSALNTVATSFVSVANTANRLDQTGDFTYEGWFNYITMPTTGYQNVLGQGAAGQTTFGIYVANAAANTWAAPYVLKVAKANIGDTAGLRGNTTIVAGKWYHFALTRTSGVLRIFLNGVLEGTSSATDTGSYAPGATLPIGANSNAHFSNVRYIKGTSLYTAAFTPPSAPLTAVTNTSFLIHKEPRLVDSSVNNLTVTASGTRPTFSAYSPFSDIEYSAETQGGSAYFDGAADYLTSDIADPNPYIFGSFNFNAECWVNLSSFTASGTILAFQNSTATSFPWRIIHSSAGVVSATVLNGSQLSVAGPAGLSTLHANSWNHLALVRNNDEVRLYVNGTPGNPVSVSGVLDDIGTIASIGALANGTEKMNGFVSGVRIDKRVARYIAPFTPASTAPTTEVNTSFLANFTNAGVVDDLALSDMVTFGTSAISTSQFKSGNASLSFPGNTSSYITALPNFNYNFTNTDFTVECWVRFNALTANTVIMGVAGAAVPWFLTIKSAGGLTFTINTSTAVLNPTAPTWATNRWYHIAVTKSGTSYTVWVDGVSRATATNATALVAAGSTPLTLGVYGVNKTLPLNGFLDDVRITKGTALYTAPFTPPADFSRIPV